MQEAGNDLLKQGRQLRKKLVISQAVDKYSEGLAMIAADRHGTPASAGLRVALYSNRAFAEGLLGNWRNALDSAQWALKADPQHLKSYFRAAQAAQKLKRWQLTEQLCQQGLAVMPGSAELQDILQVRVSALRRAERLWQSSQWQESTHCSCDMQMSHPISGFRRTAHPHRSILCWVHLLWHTPEAGTLNAARECDFMPCVATQYQWHKLANVYTCLKSSSINACAGVPGAGAAGARE